MGFVLRRLATAVPVLLGITVIAFLLVHVVPGDPAKVILFGTNATPAQISNLREQLGLDQSLWRQYFSFIDQLVHGNLGTSYLTQNSVAHELLSRAPDTLELTGAAVLVAIVVGVPIGMLGGIFPGSVATGSRGRSRSSASLSRTSSSRCCSC